jgi:hypothetical protein
LHSDLAGIGLAQSMQAVRVIGGLPPRWRLIGAGQLHSGRELPFSAFDVVSGLWRNQTGAE